MPPEPQESAPAALAPAPRAKYRIRFRKAGDLRLVSHHDLMHCFERMFRRADLPVPSTQGFNPRLRLWFAQSLALGVVGLNEVLELELTEPLAPDDLHRRLTAQCPPGMAILAVKTIAPKASAQVRRAHFRLPLTEPLPDLPPRCAAFLAQEHHWIDRTRPHPRRLDIRPFVATLTAHADGVTMALWVTPYGAVRPDEIADALGLRELLDAGAILERTDLELADEATDDTPLPAGLPMQPSTKEPTTGARGDPVSAVRPTAIITGPLSFDS